MKNISEKALLVFLIALAIIIGFTLNNQIEEKNNNLVNQINNLNSIVNNQNYEISNLYSRIEELLAKQASIVDDYAITYGAFDGDNLTYEVSLRVTPKVSGEGMTAAVSIGDVRKEMSRGQNAYFTTVNVPVANESRLAVTFSENGKSSNETFPDSISFRENYLSQMKSGFSGGTAYRDNKLQVNGELLIGYFVPRASGALTARLFANLDNEEIWSKEVVFGTQKETRINIDETFSANSGSHFNMFVENRDKKGITYRYPLYGLTVPGSDTGTRNSLEPEMGRYPPGDCILYDQYGNEIKYN